MALLPANVLVSDPSSEWMRFAVPLVLQHDLSTYPQWITEIVNSESGAYQGNASSILQATVEERRGGLSVRAVLTDLRTHRNVSVYGPLAGSSIVLSLDALAKTIDSRAADFSTSNVAALKAFTEAAQAKTVDARAEKLQDALTLDPTFGLAYILLFETLAPKGEQALLPVVSAARAREAGFRPLDRAQLEAVLAHIVRAPLSQQEKAMSTLLNLAPNNVDALSGLAQDRFLQGEATEGERLLRKAMELSPNNPNLQRQLAEGLIQTRQYKAAEKILTGLDQNPTILPMLSSCVLLEGDSARANMVFDRFLASVPSPDLKTLFRASWLGISAGPQKAIDFTRQAHFGDNRAAALAFSEMTIWHLMLKDNAGAKESANAASATGAPIPFVAIANLLSTTPSTAEQWSATVQSAPLPSNQKALLLGYGGFLYGFYPQAANVWQALLKQTGDADLRARAMAAASLTRAGNRAEAGKILVQPFVPDLGDLYAALSFREMRSLVQPAP